MKLVLIIMILMGVLGGTMNFLLATGDTVSGWRGWGKAVLLGMGAAILIPLFLNTISSDLPSSAEAGTLERVTAAAPTLPSEDRQFLQEIDRSKYTLRSAWGIAQQLGKPIAEVNETLQGLEASGLVSRMQGKKGERWALSAAGREAVNTG